MQISSVFMNPLLQVLSQKADLGIHLKKGLRYKELIHTTENLYGSYPQYSGESPTYAPAS